jgi:hypothetical protein
LLRWNRGPRLTLQHVSPSRASRARAARSKAWPRALAGRRRGYGMHAIGAGLASAPGAGTFVLMAWRAWRYWRHFTDSTQVFEQDDRIDFDQCQWHFCTLYADVTVSPLIDSAALDDSMLLCSVYPRSTGCFTDVSLCKTSLFDPRVLPDGMTSIGAMQSGEAALAFAVAIAQCWGIPCWQHSAAFDDQSKRVC